MKCSSKDQKEISEGNGEVLVRTSNGWAEGQGGEAKDKEGARGEWESTTGEEVVNVGDTGGDGRWHPRVGRWGIGDRTGASISIASESVGVIRRGERSISRTILPTTEGGRGYLFRGGRQLGRGKSKEADKVEIGLRKGIKEEQERCW